MTDGIFAAVPVFLRMRVKATRNGIAAMAAPATGPRGGTARKEQFEPSRLILLFLFFSTALSFGFIGLMARDFGESLLGRNAGAGRMILAGARTEGFLMLISLMALLWCVTVLIFSIGYQNRDLARLGDDVEFLMSLPLSLPAIYTAKVVERTILSLGWIILTPFYAAVMWHSGHRLAAIPVALVVTLLMNFLLAVSQFVLELIVRRSFETFTLTRIQSIATASTSLLLTTGMLIPMISTQTSPAIRSAAVEIGRIALFLPAGILLPLLITGSQWWRLAAFAIELAVLILLGRIMIEQLTSRGLESIQGAARSTRTKKRTSSFAHGILAKDLLMLRRDSRLFAVAVAPMIGFAPLMLMPEIFPVATASVRVWGCLALGVGMMLVQSTATSAILHERDALWILFSLPASLERVMFQKAMIWFSLGSLASLLILLAGTTVRGAFVLQDFVAFVWIIAGLFLFSLICVSFAILGSDPLSVQPKMQIRQDLMIGAMLLGMIVVAAPAIPRIDVQVVLLLFLATLAWACWRKAIYRAPALLDPTSWPEARIELADGMTGVVLIFAGQAALTVAFVEAGLTPPLAGGFAYLIAAVGALSVLASTLKEEGLKLSTTFVLMPPALRELRAGAVTVVLGTIASAAAIVATFALMRQRTSGLNLPADTGWQLYVSLIVGPLTAFVVKPIVDEILFRGIVFRTMRETLSFGVAASFSALLSAFMMGAVFAPVFFIVGFASSIAVERSKALGPSIILHALAMGVFAATPRILAQF